MVRKLALLAIVAASLAISAPAFATAYTFTSSSTFSNCVNCVISPTDVITWPGGDDSSSLTSYFPGSQSGTTAAGQPDQIGSLSWYNDSTDSKPTVSATLNIALSFTQPTPGATGNFLLSLGITNTSDGGLCFIFFQVTCKPDTIGGLTSPSSITVDGLVISNLTFVESGGGSFSNGVWTNPEFNLDTLKIYANIAAAPVAVPELTSIALLGSGLAGLGLLRRSRKKAKKAA